MASSMDSIAAEIKDALQKNNMTLAAAKIKEYLQKAPNTPLNIGITGESGSGKSSFVNAFRGVDQWDEQRAAPTGCVETTMDVKAYSHPSYPNVTVWDLPGIGTTKFPADKYLEHVKFKRFNVFIIISDTRFRENDVKLAKEIQRMGKKFYFVRSKIDNDINAEQRRQRGNFNEESTLKRIRDNCVQGLQGAGVRYPQVFLLSNFYYHLYDLSRLHETLIKELPQHKRDAVKSAVSVLPKISREVIGDKKRAFKSKITHYAWISAAGAAVPIPGLSVAVDGAMMVTVVREYRDGFGLDETSLRRLANSSGVHLRDLTTVARSPLVSDRISADLLIKLLLQSASIAALIAAEEGFSFIPIIGSVVAATLSYKVTEMALESFLDMLAEDAQRVFEKALDGLRNAV